MKYLLLGLLATNLVFAQIKSNPNEKQSPYDKPISGKVLEKINAASYTYLKIKTSTEDIWVAVPQLEIKLNTEVELQKPMPMFGFESKTLKRKFDKIYFGVLKSQKDEMLKQQQKQMEKK
jgi:hypothetical protein